MKIPTLGFFSLAREKKILTRSWPAGPVEKILTRPWAAGRQGLALAFLSLEARNIVKHKQKLYFGPGVKNPNTSRREK